MRTETLLPARYRDAELIARGGMGEVYCAVDASLGRPVAIKLLDERLADFGVASAGGFDSLTQTGMVVGTAGYLSPEQAQGRPPTPASDRYALGVVAFELLAGERPFENDNPTAEAAAHVHAPIPSISERARGTPRDVDRVFARALAKDPDRRFASCRQLVAALRSAFEADAATTRVVAPPRAPRRRRTWRALLLLLALAGVAAGIVVGTQRGGSPRDAARPVTITQQGTTVVHTVTGQSPPTTTAAVPDGAALASQGYSKLQAGDYGGALPLLEQAAQRLSGSGSLDEAYNDYNLAYALARTQGCSGRVLQPLDASQSIQGHRSEINKLRASCKQAGA